MKKIIETYKVIADFVPATVTIMDITEENVPIYEVTMPEFDVGTKALLGKIMEDLARVIPVSVEETTDPKKMDELKTRFFDAAKKEISKKFPRMTSESINIFSGVLLHNMYGLGDIEIILADLLLEEIVINNSLTPIAVYHKKYGWLKTTKTLNKEDEIYNLASQIGRKSGRQISLLNPIMDAHLITGDRVAATLFPISTQGNTITIRKFSRSPWNIITLIKNKGISKEMVAFLWLALQYELNVMVAGATATGKCMTGDTLVHLKNGKRIPIRDVVESAFANQKILMNDSWEYVEVNNLNVLSLDQENLQIVPAKVERVWRHKAPETLFNLETSSGRTITVTGEHPFFFLNENGSLEKIRADHLEKGQRIAVPRKISCITKEKENLWSYIENDPLLFVPERKEQVKMMSKKLLEKYGLKYQKDLTKKFGIKPQRFRYWTQENAIPLQMYTKLRKESEIKDNYPYLKSKTSSEKIKIPEISPDLLRFIALVIADGYLHKDKVSIKFSNNNKKLLEEFLILAQNLFGVTGSISYPKERVSCSVVHSSALSRVLHLACRIPYGKKARKVVIPEFLLSQGKESILAFLSGMIDCDGYVGPYYIEISSRSKSLLQGISTSLLQLGVISHMSHTGNSRLTIYGYDSIVKLKNIPLVKEDKKRNLHALLNKGTQKTYNKDTIPALHKMIIRTRNEMGLSQKAFAHELQVCRQAVSHWERGVRNPSLSNIAEIAESFGEGFPFFTKMRDSDVFWDEIHAVTPITNHKEEYVYDFTVREHHTFLAGEIPFIAHNTSVLNALVALIPPNQRILSIKDTREIFLPESLHWNWVPMSSRTPNAEGQGAISMLDLMIASLRMRPDRIIVGEVRRKDQVETMFEAMHTGHSVYTTIHAETVQQVLRRLLEPPISIPKTELESLHLILIQYRDRRRNLRRSLELAELLAGGKEEMEVNYLYRWRARKDTFEKINQSIRVFEDLNLHTGMTQQEIMKDLNQKEQILQWLLDNNVENIDLLGKIMKIYYKTPDVILEAANKKQKPEAIVL